MTLYLVAKCRIALDSAKFDGEDYLKKVKEQMLEDNIGQHFHRFTLEVESENTYFEEGATK